MSKKATAENFEIEEDFQPQFKVLPQFEELLYDNTLHLNEPQITQHLNIVTILVEVPELQRRVNLFLVVGGKKYDMYYQAKKGIFKFSLPQNIYLENDIEIFYAQGLRKSNTVTIRKNTRVTREV